MDLSCFYGFVLYNVIQSLCYVCLHISCHYAHCIIPDKIMPLCKYITFFDVMDLSTPPHPPTPALHFVLVLSLFYLHHHNHHHPFLYFIFVSFKLYVCYF